MEWLLLFVLVLLSAVGIGYLASLETIRSFWSNNRTVFIVPIWAIIFVFLLQNLFHAFVEINGLWEWFLVWLIFTASGTFLVATTIAVNNKDSKD